MNENERKEMMNLADTINGEINRMCVTKEQTEFDSMYLHARKNIEKLAWLIYKARFKAESEESQQTAERDCEHCVHRKDKGCEKWDCEFERRTG